MIHGYERIAVPLCLTQINNRLEPRPMVTPLITPIIMSRSDPEAQNLTVDDFEYHSDEEQNGTDRTPRPNRPAPQTFKSQYTIQTSERLKGVANRIIFSRYYILFYFIMMSLSLTTVVLSLMATRKSTCRSLRAGSDQFRQGRVPTFRLACVGDHHQWDDGSGGLYAMGCVWKG
jgi:hypothetical protein